MFSKGVGGGEAAPYGTNTKRKQKTNLRSSTRTVLVLRVPWQTPCECMNASAAAVWTSTVRRFVYRSSVYGPSMSGLSSHAERVSGAKTGRTNRKRLPPATIGGMYPRIVAMLGWCIAASA